jgi:hypothetical protein
MNKQILIVFTIIALVAVSSFCLAGVNGSIVSQATTAANANGLTSRSYIRINGAISQWETTPVRGFLQTQARIGTFENGNTNQLASATAIWTTNLSRPIMAVASKQNFTYVFYEAKLANASVSTLSSSTSSADYVLSGTWNLFNVTSKVTIITNDNGQITAVHRTMDKTIQKVSGTLSVTDNWSVFTLSLTNIDPLTGSVARSVIRQVAFNPFKVTDDITTKVVTKADIAAVIRSYGAMPGYGNYDPKMDFCGHFKIDIAALSTVASNM